MLNHDDSASQVAEVMHPGVFIRSFYFTDPDGVMLEFACWTGEFSDDEPKVVGRTDAERRPRPHPGPAS